MRTCCILGCNRPHYGRGYCRAHWKRWKRHGDPFGGSTDWGAAKAFIEQAIKHGDTVECLLWPFAHAGNGYGKVFYNGRRNQFSHRVVCEGRHGPPPTPKHHAAHSCGKGHLGCVNPHHLEWKLPVENNADKTAHGTINRGVRNGVSKLTEAEALQIKALGGVETQQALADRFGVSRSTVSDIQRGRRWAWLPQKENIMERQIIGAQGEITIFRIGEMPAGLVSHSEKDRLGRPIISHSESGHHHVLDAAIDVLEKPDAPQGMRILYALLGRPVALVQDAPDAHGKHDLEPGLYEFRIAREFDPFAEQARRVAD